MGQGEYKAFQLYGKNKYPSFKEKTILNKIMIKSKLGYWIYRQIYKDFEIWIHQLINYFCAWRQQKKKIRQIIKTPLADKKKEELLFFIR